MFNNIRENRIQQDGLYKVTLQMPESDYFAAYDSITSDAAYEILGNYLAYHQDDGRVSDVDIKHNSNGHVVNISANLHYMGNTHSDIRKTPDYLNITRENEKRV